MKIATDFLVSIEWSDANRGNYEDTFLDTLRETATTLQIVNYIT